MGIFDPTLPTLDGGLVQIGNGAVRARSVRIESGYTVPFWLRNQSGLVMKVSALPFQCVIPVGSLEALSTDPEGAVLESGYFTTSVVGPHVIGLHGTAPTGGVAPYTYKWYRGYGYQFILPGGGDLLPATTLEAQDVGLAPDSCFYYRLIATDAVGTVVSSHDNSGSTTRALTVGVASAAAAGAASIILAATAPVGGTPGYTYQWYRGLTTGFVPGVGNAVAGATALNFTDTGLAAATQYFYKLRATDSDGTPVVVTYGVTSATTGAALAAGTVAARGASATTADLTSSPTTGGTAPYTYQWHRSTSPGFVPGGGNAIGGATTLAYTDTGRAQGTTYYYKLVATDNAAATVTSAQVSAIPAPKFGDQEPDGMTVQFADDLSTDYSYGVAFPTGTSNVAVWKKGAGYPGAPEGGPPGNGNFGGLYHEWPIASPKQECYCSFVFKTSDPHDFQPGYTKIAWLGLVGEGVFSAGMVIGASSAGLGNTIAIAQQYPPGFTANWNTSSPSIGQIPRGVDVTVQIRARGNDAGQSNGWMKLWMNGELCLDLTGMTMAIGGLVGKFSGVKLDPYWGGQGDSKEYDDSIEYKEYYMSGKD